MTTVGSWDGRNYARVNLKLTERGERARSQKDLERDIRRALQPIPGIELALGYDRPIWVNLLGPDPDTLKQLINAFAEKVAKVPGIADMETSEKAASRRRGRPRHFGAAGRCHGASAARGRDGHVLAGTRRTELRGQCAAAEGGPKARLRSRQSVSVDQQARARRRAAHGAFASSRGDRRNDEPADHQAAGSPTTRRALRQRGGTSLG